MRWLSAVAVLIVCWSLAAQEPGAITIEGMWVSQWVRDGAKRGNAYKNQICLFRRALLRIHDHRG
jgi:hypothetical protein